LKLLLSKKLQGCVYCLLFDFQGPVIASAKCFGKRRRRDLNPRAVISDLLPFQGSPFNHLGTSAQSTVPESTSLICGLPLKLFPAVFLRSACVPLSRAAIKANRRGWDSNPCALTDKRFSRPPRYDRFDTSPNVLFYSKGGLPICQAE
jgi:hypothetical protein